MDFNYLKENPVIKLSMKDFKNSKIYKLTDNSTNKCYIGSTTGDITIRLSGHISHTKIGRHISSHEIISQGDYRIDIIEYYPCNNNKELRIREQYWIDNTICINERRAYMTKEQRLESNRICDKKRTRDHKPYLKNYRDYRSSWGGDPRTQNCLLLIDLDCFN